VGANSDIVADFTGYGVYEYLTGYKQWRYLTPSNASLLAMDGSGDVFAAFPGYGVWKYTATHAAWSLFLSENASALAVNAQGDLIVSLPSLQRVLEYPSLPNTNGLFVGTSSNLLGLAIDGFGDATLSYTGYGVQEYHRAIDPNAREQFPTSATLVAIDGDGNEYADFAGAGVWEFDGFLGWHQLPQPGAGGSLPPGQSPPLGDAFLLAAG